jgi:hypothetical protein
MECKEKKMEVKIMSDIFEQAVNVGA